MGEKRWPLHSHLGLQPIACQLIAHASLITGRQYVHSLLLMGNERAPSALPWSAVPAVHYNPGARQRYPRRGRETQVWTVIFKTASVPASQHILRSPFPSFPPIEQSRCSIPPFERCRATPRSLLEHLVDRSTSLLSSLSRGFGLIFLRTALPFASLYPDLNLLSTVSSLYP